MVNLLAKVASMFLSDIQLNTRRDKNMAVNNDVKRPMIKVVAKPLTGPEPKITRTTPVIRVVTFPSIMAE